MRRRMHFSLHAAMNPDVGRLHSVVQADLFLNTQRLDFVLREGEQRVVSSGGGTESSEQWFFCAVV